ncbi:MAG TPA: hypothetical protein PKD86_01705, partial [Gemmatales bacterium]|nr:hypothetical protein [Gemmatales bacterium]
MAPVTEALAPIGWRGQVDRVLGWLIEALLFGMIAAGPWLFGAIDAPFQAIFHLGIALALVLWCLRWLVRGWLDWRWDPVPLVLAALLLWGLIQTMPLPRSWIDWLSPAAAQLYDDLLPAQQEVLPEGGVPV